MQRRERESLDGAGLFGGEVVQHREHALLDRLAHGLACEHAHDTFDRHIRLLGDLDQNRHTGRVGQARSHDYDNSCPRPRGFESGERAMLIPWTLLQVSA